MKKKIIYSSLVAASLCASSIALAGGPEVIPAPNYFEGFYVGGIGGVHHATFDGNTVINVNDEILRGELFPVSITIPEGPLLVSDASGGGWGGYGGVQGGFGHVFNHSIYVGIQGFGEWGSASNTDSVNGFVTSLPVIAVSDLEEIVTGAANIAVSTSTKTKIENDWGFAGKFGWLVSPTSMIYGKVGASWARIKVSTNASATVNIATATTDTPPELVLASNENVSASASDEDTKLGLLLGVGFEQFVYQDMVSVNVEYTYANYGHVTTPAATFTGQAVVTPVVAFPGETFVLPVNQTNVTTQASASVKVSSLMAGLNFYFGDRWL